jgi:hypothetical protein
LSLERFPGIVFVSLGLQPMIVEEEEKTLAIAVRLFF